MSIGVDLHALQDQICAYAYYALGSQHQALLADRFGEPKGRESQAGSAGLEGTYSTNTQQDTTQQHYSAQN